MRSSNTAEREAPRQAREPGLRRGWIGALAVAALSLAMAAATVPADDGGSGVGQGEDFDCAKRRVHCVDDTPGATQEYDVIQDAVDRARKGHTVVVFAGEYAGFRVRRNGRRRRPITIMAADPTVRITSPEPRSGEGIYIQNADYVIIDGFIVDGNGVMEIGIGAHDARPNNPMVGVEIRNNVVGDTISTAIYASNVADSSIVGNTAFGSFESHGFYLANAGSDGTILRGNHSYDNESAGIHFNGDISVGGDGVQSGLLVEENVIHDNGSNGLNMDGVRDSELRNNLIYSNYRHGVRAYAIDAAAGPKNLVIVNNTFYGNGGWAVKLTADEGGHAVFNNILLSDGGSLVVDHPDFASDHNIVANAFSLDGEATVLLFGEWQARGFDPASLREKASRVFRNPRRERFELKGGSPAIDLGVDRFDGRSAPGVDIEGTERPQKRAIDAGAFEKG